MCGLEFRLTASTSTVVPETCKVGNDAGRVSYSQKLTAQWARGYSEEGDEVIRGLWRLPKMFRE